MKSGTSGCAFFLGSLCWLFFSVQPTEATQVHSAPEGLYAHQIAHFFFMFSMGILIYWLRERNLVQEVGWRFIQYAAFLFILWNLDALLAHYLDGRGDLFKTINAGSWNAHIYLSNDSKWLAILYYVVKLDHLFCVPAILFLYLGLRRLLKQAQEV